MSTVARFGSWRSPITAALLVEKAVQLSQVVVDGGDVYWNELRPAEGGRQVIVRRGHGGSVVDVIPAGFSARSLVHEYGGQSFAVWRETVFFSNFDDQRVYRLSPGAAVPQAITDEPPRPRSVRYADPVVTPDGRWLVCVRERHLGDGVVNDIVAISSTGGGVHDLAGGYDFFSAPRVSPEGSTLCWLSWNHPNMPWDGTELWAAPLRDGRLAGAPRKVAGGRRESVSQPRWSRDSRLHYVSDRSGWWNLYGDQEGPLARREAEFTGPDWVFGQSTYAFLDDTTLVAAWSEQGMGHIGIVGGRGLQEISLPYTWFDWLQPVTGGLVAIAGSPAEAPALVRVRLPAAEVEVLRRSREVTVDPGYLSEPEALEFPTEGGRTGHALFYRPRNHRFEGRGRSHGRQAEKPPLVVMSHGGPTSATSSLLNLSVQYWTSRGMAVVDVNYGGSTGYGREYRERLRHRWGVVDVDDCVNAARHLAALGEVDSDRTVIRGSSAGGYTTLAALAFRNAFAAGASHYGVADVEALAQNTHKFESRYLDGLIGPYPAARDLYVERSPIHHANRLDRPMILFQGLEDEVVPPEQAEMMADALRRNGVPFAYLAFEGEQHGFRRAETVKRVAEAELWFYGRVLGFSPSDEIEPVPIENEERLGGFVG